MGLNGELLRQKIGRDSESCLDVFVFQSGALSCDKAASAQAL